MSKSKRQHTEHETPPVAHEAPQRLPDNHAQHQAWKRQMRDIYQTHYGAHPAADYQQSLHVMPSEAQAGQGDRG